MQHVLEGLGRQTWLGKITVKCNRVHKCGNATCEENIRGAAKLPPPPYVPHSFNNDGGGGGRRGSLVWKIV